MRSLLRRGRGNHALPRLADHPAAPRRPGRALRGAARGSLLVALIAGTSAFAAHAVTTASDREEVGSLTDIFAEVVPGEALENALRGSRSEARVALGDTSIHVDGQVLPVPADAETVADALDLAEVSLGADDEVSLPLDSPVPQGQPIVVSRVAFVEEVARVETPFSVTEEPDAALAVGERVLVSAGQPGLDAVVYRVKLVDGVEVSREELFRTAAAPVAEVVRVGAEPRSIARSMVAARGWGEDQFSCLDRLWTKESNWNPSAQNPSSGAYGIPQSLPGSKMATVADDWRTNPATQITWGLNYIEGRYGTPCAAWAHSQAVNWY